MALWNGQKVKASKNSPACTHRLSLRLEEPTECDTNEFSYAQLILQEQQQEGAQESFEGNPDTKLAAIAKRLEEKYGPTAKKRKRVSHEQDLLDLDLGYGYDVNDTFVDDSERCDDYIPPEMDTKFGGFYINTGELQYMQTSGDDFEIFEEPIKKKPKVTKQPSHATPKTILANKKLKLAKQNIASSAQRGKLNKMAPKIIIRKSLVSEKGSKVPKTTFQSSLSTNDRQSATGASEGSDITSSDLHESASVTDLIVDSEPKESKPPPVLPDTLPSRLKEIIRQFVESVKTQEKDGKLSIRARSEYNNVLLDIDSETKGLKARTLVFEYVAYQFGITKASLVSRLKRIQKKQETDVLEEPLKRLKEAVDAVMQNLESKYQAELKACAEQQTKLSTSDGHSQMDECSSHDDSAFVSNNNQVETSKVKKPRKRFTWTPEIKSCLAEVVKLKVQQELTNRPKPLNGEEIMLEFLDHRVKPIWPKGWIQRKVLYKQTEQSHKPLTSTDASTASSVVPTKKLVQTNPKTVVIKNDSDQKIPTASSISVSSSQLSTLSANASSNAVAVSGVTLAGHTVPKSVGLISSKSIALLPKQSSTVSLSPGTPHVLLQTKSSLPSVRPLTSTTSGQKPLVHSSVVKSKLVSQTPRTVSQTPRTVSQTPSAKTVGRTSAAKTVSQMSAAKTTPVAKSVGQMSAAKIILGQNTPQSTRSLLQTTTSGGQRVVNFSPEFINRVLGSLQSDGSKHNILQVLSNKESPQTNAQPVVMQQASTVQPQPINVKSSSVSVTGKTAFVQPKQGAFHSPKLATSLSPSEANKSLLLLQKDHSSITTPSSPSLLGAVSQVQQVAHIVPTTLSSSLPLFTRSSPSYTAQSPQLQYLNTFPSAVPITKPNTAAILAAQQHQRVMASRSPPKLVTSPPKQVASHLPTTTSLGLSSPGTNMSSLISPLATFSPRPTGTYKPRMTSSKPATSSSIPLTHNPYLSSIAYAPTLPVVSTASTSSATQLPSQNNADVFTANLHGSKR